MPMAGIKYKLK